METWRSLAKTGADRRYLTAATCSAVPNPRRFLHGHHCRYTSAVIARPYKIQHGSSTLCSSSRAASPASHTPTSPLAILCATHGATASPLGNALVHISDVHAAQQLPGPLSARVMWPRWTMSPGYAMMPCVTFCTRSVTRFLTPDYFPGCHACVWELCLSQLSQQQPLMAV